MTGDVISLRSEMIGEVGVRQLISDDGWEEMRSEQRYPYVTVANSINVGRELE